VIGQRSAGRRRHAAGLRFNWSYDYAGNLTSSTANGTSTTFNYDTADELTSASGGLNATYGYDANGDRTSATTGSGTQTINVNTAAQITSITPPGGSAIPYSCTGMGEQERIGAGSNSFRYDGTGLSKQTDSVGDTYYTSLPDGTLLAEAIPGESRRARDRPAVLPVRTTTSATARARWRR
jgi:YD repeat-containing protein